MAGAESFARSFRALNREQKAAASATEGYVRVIAGAGSGKTRALTHRYAYLIHAAGIHPSNILCVTFTNKAAGEMKKRVRSLVGDGYDTSLITTYHGFCVRVLREDIHRLMWPKSFTILDEGDQRRILSEIYAELEIKMDRATFERILDAVHRLKSNESYVAAMLRGDTASLTPPPASPAEPPAPLETEIVRRYIGKQRKLFGLDFDDLVSFAFALFRDFPETAEKWAERLYYIQVDEFQDSSKRELRLLKLLSSRHHNLFVVGDPDQNIYEWRGADMSILVDFEKHFPGARTILMDRNYRSTGHILRAANTLIAHNRNRYPKDLRTEGPDGEDVIHLHAKTEDEEGRWITDEMLRLNREAGIPFKGMAVLYRAGFLSRFVEQAMTKAAVPYELYGGVRFYERMEIRDTLSYLRLIQRDDDDAFERIVNTPRRSFGRAKTEALRLIAREEGLSLYAALLAHLNDPLFARTGAPEFAAMIGELRERAETMPVSELMQTVLTRSGYEQYIRELGSMERLDNLAEMKRSVWEREQGYGEFYPLSVYLQEAALENDREAEDGADRVKLMTIHASKGLEFPVCFVVGFTEGIFPSGRTLEERKDAGLEEERRLCFVAMTRAMDRLYLTESEGASSDRTTKRPSRFLWDTGEENYRRVGVIPKELAEGSGTGSVRETPQDGRSSGSRVEHPIFGPGTVENTDPNKGMYYIRFDRTGELRPISMDYRFDAPLALDLGLDEEDETPPASPPEPGPEEPAELSLSESAEVTELPEELELPLPDLPEEPELPPPDPPEEKKATYPWDRIGERIPPKPAVPPDKPAVPAKMEKSPRRRKEDDGQIAMSLPENDPPSVMPDRYRFAEWARAPEGEENLWKRDDVPHDGWECVDVIDLGEPAGVCRMCGHQIIRYVHVMRHPDYPRTIGAGCVCAGRMEGDPEAARNREAAFKNRQSRRETFIHATLKRSRKGNEYIKYRGELVTLLPDRFHAGYWKTAVRNVFTDPRLTREEALGDAFDILDPWTLGETEQ